MLTIYAVVGQDLKLFTSRLEAIKHILNEGKHYDIDYWDDVSGWVPVQSLEETDLLNLSDEEINTVFDGCCEISTHCLKLD